MVLKSVIEAWSLFQAFITRVVKIKLWSCNYWNVCTA